MFSGKAQYDISLWLLRHNALVQPLSPELPLRRGQQATLREAYAVSAKPHKGSVSRPQPPAQQNSEAPWLVDLHYRVLVAAGLKLSGVSPLTGRQRVERGRTRLFDRQNTGARVFLK